MLVKHIIVNKGRIMKTFTYIINAGFKHCFAYQYQSEILAKDTLLRLVSDAKHISLKMKQLFIADIKEWYDPVKLDCVKHVWRDIFLIEDLMYRYDVNMVETEMSDTAFPLSEKATFTFITHIRHYNASYQFKVATLEEGLMLWATTNNLLNRQQRKILLKYIQKSKNNPQPVDGLKNVWATSYKIFRPILSLHIIKTVE